MEINVGGTSIAIPDDLIDYDDFASVALKVAPHAFHMRDTEIDVRMNWGAGDLDKIGKRLKSYEGVVQIAKAAGCRKIGSVSVRLAEMYLNPDMWDGTDFELVWQTAILEGNITKELDDRPITQKLFKKLGEEQLTKEQ